MIHKQHVEITVSGADEPMCETLQEESGYREEIPGFITSVIAFPLITTQKNNCFCHF